MAPKSKYSSTVPAVDQAMRLLHCLAESAIPQLTLTELCNMLDINKSKAYTILNTLMNHDFVEKNQQAKTYRLGLGIVSLSRNILNNLDIRDFVVAPLKDLADQTGLTAHFGQVVGERVYIIAKEESDKSYGYSIRIGIHHHLSHGAHGKAIAAYMDDEAREKLLQQEGLEFYGPDQPVDFEYLREEFEEIRQTGYAVDPRETNPNIIGISSPVFEIAGKIRGGVILVGASSRARVKEYGPLVVRTALQISRALGFRGVFPSAGR